MVYTSHFEFFLSTNPGVVYIYIYIYGVPTICFVKSSLFVWYLLFGNQSWICRFSLFYGLRARRANPARLLGSGKSPKVLRLLTAFVISAWGTTPVALRVLNGFVICVMVSARVLSKVYYAGGLRPDRRAWSFSAKRGVTLKHGFQTRG